ncbi:hypothetical protein Droror1_Dr00026629 [Drosera rotundifolia]
MGVSDQKAWVPYMNTKDCSQGICSIYCPQWCYIIFPPPPTVSSNDDAGAHLSPIVISIISILAFALLIVSYYAILSKFCSNVEPGNQEHNLGQTEENHDASSLEPWFVNSNGLDESVIKLITACKYRRGDGLVESTDCCVCLGEFEEDETLRLLPKCSHAFHVICIDTWLKSHSNCPLCRASVVSPCLKSLSPFAAQAYDLENHDSLPEREHQHVQNVDYDNIEEETSLQNENESKNNSEVDLQRYAIVEIIDDEHMVRRSVSMDYLWPSRVITAHILGDEEEGHQSEECELHEVVVSKKALIQMGNSCSGGCSSSSRSGVLDSVARSMSMRRSVSGGRFLFSRSERGVRAVVPL